jgi:subtilisin family serine protease
MGSGWLTRVLLAAVIAAATGMHDARAQCITNVCPPTPTPAPAPTVTTTTTTFVPPSHRDNGKWYALGGVAFPLIGLLVIKFPFSPENGPGSGVPPSSFPRGQPSQAQLPGNLPLLPGAGAGGGGTVGQALRRGFDLPPAGETRYVKDEVILEFPNVPTLITAVAASHNMTLLATGTYFGRTAHRWHIDSGVSVADMITSTSADRQIGGAQPNYLYRLAQTDQVPINADQYAPQKLYLAEAHRLARGNRILIAVIDSEVDASHPDLAGAITANFEVSADDERPHPHGTGMAGAIAARRNMLGIAPGVGLLTVRAFSTKANSAEGTTFNIIKGLDWAAAQGARVVNMSFAGPSDPRLRDALAKAKKKGMVLIAAAGNAGPNSPPLYPAADPNVIAVTATNADDALFTGANRGNYIAVAAPGVDIFAPAPDGTYQFTTGTSVAAAEVSGVAALLIERNPALTPAEVRKILMDTAKDLGPKGRDRDFGAGLVNALKALTAVRPR